MKLRHVSNSLVLILAAHLGFGAAATYTNVNGIALGLELPVATVAAGESLRAWMIVSNYSSVEVVGRWDGTRGPRDTAIGDFVVTDSFGARLPKTVPYTEWDREERPRSLRLQPGEARRFEGDVVYGYSLTNPGTYTVKAIARVPTTNENLRGMMVIETSPVPIEIVPRSQDLPPPKPLYNIPAGMNIDEVRELTARQLAALPVLEVTYDNPDAILPANGAQETPKRVPLSSDSQTFAVRATNPGLSEQQSTTAHARNVFYGLIVLSGFAAAAAIVWHSRRKQRDP